MSHHVYPVTKTNDQCNDYEVLVNGVPAELNTARVSAYPFNRRWPGHQRQIEQTELINFLSMESDEEAELGSVRDVRIEDLQLYALQKPKFVFLGASDHSPCANVTLDGVYWNGEPISRTLFERQTEANEFVSGLKFIEGQGH